MSKRKRKKNLYYDCIEILKKRVRYLDNRVIHYHHVLPIHDGGKKDGETIPCTHRDHARMHYIRWLVYRQPMDLAAYKGLVNKTDDMHVIIQQKRINTLIKKGILFYSIKWQSEQGSKPKAIYFDNPEIAKKYAYSGGVASGQIWTDAKLTSSKKKGKILGNLFGKIGGLKHQNKNTKNLLLTKAIIWNHSHSGIKVKTYGYDTVNSLAHALEKVAPGYIKNTQAISAVLRNTEPRRYGWAISEILELELQNLKNLAPTIEIINDKNN